MYCEDTVYESYLLGGGGGEERGELVEANFVGLRLHTNGKTNDIACYSEEYSKH